MDRAQFAAVVEGFRGELRVHCYRILGSFDEAEDLVQETLLRAWKALDSFQGRSSIRAWLYRIATNACLDALDGQSRRVLPHHLAPASDVPRPQQARGDVPWLQPFPDRLWEPVASFSDEPESAIVAKETMELAFLAAIQHLPPRQRAVLILHDVLGWPTGQTAVALDASMASVTSALQRARVTMRQHLPVHRLDWAPARPPSQQERTVLHRYMAAVERGDLAALADLLAEDVRTTMPPYPSWFAGRDAVLASLYASWDPQSSVYVGTLRTVPVGANGQPAAAVYVRGPHEPVYRPFAIAVLSIQSARVTEITAFHDPRLFPAFALPPVLADR